MANEAKKAVVSWSTPEGVVELEIRDTVEFFACVARALNIPSGQTISEEDVASYVCQVIGNVRE